MKGEGGLGWGNPILGKANHKFGFRSGGEIGKKKDRKCELKD